MSSIIGAGIAGISTAYELAMEGSRSSCVDRGKIAGGITARTTAHLAPLCDDLTSAMIKSARRGNVPPVLRKPGGSGGSHRGNPESGKHRLRFSAPRRLSVSGAQHRLEDHRRGTGCGPQGRRARPSAGRRAPRPLRRAARAALSAPGHVSSPQISRGACRRHRGKGRKLSLRHGRRRFEERTTARSSSRPAAGRSRARAAVVATNSPIVDRFALHTKMAPYRTYAMAFTIPHGAIRTRCTGTRSTPIIMCGCSRAMAEPTFSSSAARDHKSGEADDAEVRFQALEAWTRNLIPAAKDVTHRWSGQVLDTIDYAGFIGRNPGKQEHLCAYRRFRPGHDPRRGRAP